MSDQHSNLNVSPIYSSFYSHLYFTDIFQIFLIFLTTCWHLISGGHNWSWHLLSLVWSFTVSIKQWVVIVNGLWWGYSLWEIWDSIDYASVPFIRSMGWRYHPRHTGSHAKCLKYLPAHPWEALVQNSKGFSSWYQVLHNFCKLYIGYHIRHSLDTHLFIPELFGKTILLTYIISLSIFPFVALPHFYPQHF